MKKVFSKNEWRKQKYKKEPWWRTWNYINNRCRYNSAYNGVNRKVKNLLTVEDLKMLWFRDDAINMDKPSIDRIKENQHYSFKNCRYIELLENQKRPKHIYQRHPRYIIGDRWSKNYKCCVMCGETQRKHTGRGFCSRCHQKWWSDNNREHKRQWLRNWRKKNA